MQKRVREGSGKHGLELPVRLLVIASILLLAGSAGSQEVLFADPGGADHLDSYGASLIWSSADCGGGDFEICLIRDSGVNAESIPATPHSTFDNGGGDPNDNLASNLDHTRGYVYWLSKGGQVLRFYRDRQFAPTILSSMATPGAVGEIAVDDTYVYWIENMPGQGSLYRAPVGGGPREFVMDSPNGPASQLQVDGAGRVYFIADLFVSLFCCVDALHQISPDGAGGFQRDLAARSFVTGFAIDDSEVYLAHRITPSSDLLISVAPAAQIADTSAWVDLYNAGSTGPPEIRHLALGEENLFFHEQRPATSSSILRMSRSGGPPAAITLPLSDAKDLLLAGDSTESWIVWLEGGFVYRWSATGGPILRDLDADDLNVEVVQVIQDSAHTVPLSENKRTYVRAFARLASSSDGVADIHLFPAVSLSGSSGGVDLPGSPLRPLELTQSISDAFVARDTDANDFVFELPESWTVGNVDLTATVDPRDIIFETDESNNSTTRSVTFKPVGGICMDIIPVATTLGPEDGSPLSERAISFDRARTLLPTDDLVWIKRGGSPKHKPWSGDVYNFAEQDDAQELMFNWFFDFNTSGTPSQCHGRRTIRTAAVSMAARFGISSGGAALIMYLQQFAGSIPENFPSGGTSGLAHEVGHQLGQGHIGCPLPGMSGAPGNPDGGYPYAPCTLDETPDNEHVGFDPISKKVIAPYDPRSEFPQYTDFMSYGGPYWASDWVYRRHHSELAGSSPSPPAGGSGTYVVGGYQRDDGSVELGHAYVLDPTTASESAIKIGANTQPSTSLFLNIYDLNGVLQIDQPVRSTEVLEEVEGDPTWTSFIALVEYQNDYSKIEIVDGSGSVLAVQAPGAAPPSVAITSPTSGAALADTVVVDWSGTDPDTGDVLEYRLDYSPDGGATWLDVAWTRDTTATVDMTSMPTGANALFRVLVSDGVHSSEDSVGPFAIANRPPIVEIFDDRFETPADPLVSPYGASLALRGYAYDSDDGPLAGASLSWVVDGTTTASGAGERISLDLRPGGYQVDLTATDSMGATASQSIALTILPREVPDVTAFPGAPLLDGRCQDPAYAEDGERMRLRYPSDGDAEVAAAQSDEFIYFCFSGLVRHQATEFVELRIDRDSSADELMQPSDRFIRVSRDGLVESGVGDGLGGDVLDLEAVDVLVATTVSEMGWQAEIRIHETLVDPLSAVGALHGFASSGRAVWPDGLVETSPETWGEIYFVPEPGFAWGVSVGATLLSGLGAVSRSRLRRSDASRLAGLDRSRASCGSTCP